MELLLWKGKVRGNQKIKPPDHTPPELSIIFDFPGFSQQVA